MLCPSGTFILFNPLFSSEKTCSIPHGGYVLGLIMDACAQHQSQTGQPDAAHVSAQYLLATAVDECEIVIRVLRRGKSWTNLSGRLIQKVQNPGAAAPGPRDVDARSLMLSSGPNHRHRAAHLHRFTSIAWTSRVFPCQSHLGFPIAFRSNHSIHCPARSIARVQIRDPTLPIQASYARV